MYKNPERYLTKEKKAQGDDIAKKLSWIKLIYVNLLDFVAVVYVLSMIIPIIAVLIPLIALYGFLKIPDYKKQIRNIKEVFG